MELGTEARRLLELTRASRTPTDRDRARVERRVSAAIPAAGAASASHSAVGAVKAKAVATPLAVKMVAGSAAVAAIVAVGLARRPAPRAAPAAEPVAPAAVAPTLEPPAVAPPLAEPAPVMREAPPAASTSMERKNARPRAAPSDTLAQELDLLHEAQAKWRGGDAEGALSLLALHRERYPRSEVAPERDALRVLSLCATGRAAEARKAAQRFLQRYPRSPLRASVEESCALR